MLFLVVLLVGPQSAPTPAGAGQVTPVKEGPRVLFVRGESGSGGLGSGNDSHLCDITDTSTESGNHGWSQLADLLRSHGFDLVQRIEDGSSSPIFEIADLDDFDVLVLGSNNATAAGTTVDAVEAWVRAGGGLLVISDANFGSSWGDAPSADQAFLDPFGLVMNQDLGTYSVARGDGDFTAAGSLHPILEDVDAFDGEGVSPVSLGGLPHHVSASILVPAKGTIRENDAVGQGSTRIADSDDAALVALSVDSGRLVGHFDRNTFFNENGAGTDITRFDNATLALNLFRWLAGDSALIFRDGFESGSTSAWL